MFNLRKKFLKFRRGSEQWLYVILNSADIATHHYVLVPWCGWLSRLPLGRSWTACLAARPSLSWKPCTPLRWAARDFWKTFCSLQSAPPSAAGFPGVAAPSPHRWILLRLPRVRSLGCSGSWTCLHGAPGNPTSGLGGHGCSRCIFLNTTFLPAHPQFQY